MPGSLDGAYGGSPRVPERTAGCALTSPRSDAGHTTPAQDPRHRGGIEEPLRGRAGPSRRLRSALPFSIASPKLPPFRKALLFLAWGRAMRDAGKP